MSQVELASLLGEGNSKLTKGCSAYSDGPQHDIGRAGAPELDENDIRNWLKGIRDSGYFKYTPQVNLYLKKKNYNARLSCRYSVLGLSSTIGDCFFDCVESSAVTLALMENIQSMEFRHIRLLIHLVVIPMVKFCPNRLWKDWLGMVLRPLFLYCQQALNCSWMSLLQEGRAKVPDAVAVVSGSELKIEVMEDKILRDLTREICTLLSVIASPGLNGSLPSLEHISHSSRSEMSTFKDLDSLATNSMIGYV